MQEQDIALVEPQREEAENPSAFSIKEFLLACKHYWYWFVITAVLGGVLMFIYSRTQPMRYVSFAYILVKNDKTSGNISENSLFTDLGIIDRSQTVQNEIYVIRSTQLLEQVVNRLNIDVSYYVEPHLRRINIYKSSPIEVKFLKEIPRSGITVYVNLIDDTQCQYRFSTEDDWTTAKYGQSIESPKGPMLITRSPAYRSDTEYEEIIAVAENPRRKAEHMWDRLTVKKASQETSVISLQYDGDNYQECCDILNALIDVYNQDGINDKNRVAQNTENFIIERIASLGKSLGGIDSEIAQIKIRNNVPDIGSAAGSYLSSSERYYDDAAQLETQLSLVRYIRDYLRDDRNKNALIPSNTGINDLGIEGLISTYNEEAVKYNKLAAGSSADNPWTLEQEKTLATLHANIVRSVDNLYSTLSIKLRQAQAQESIARAKVSSVPAQEQQITDVLRQQKIKEDLYLYLLNKREENALRLAIAEPNAKILEYAGGDETPYGAADRRNVMMGIIIGLIIPAIIIYLIMWIRSLDTKIHGASDIETGSSIPFLGEVPLKEKEYEDKELVVSENGTDRVSEAMRIIYNNFEYVTDKNREGGAVVQVTSTIPGEGKSFITANLAMSLALAGNRVILLDLDLRKGNISKTLGIKGRHGLSGYLSGRNTDLDQIIIHGIADGKGKICENLDAISIGTVPPNPVALIMSERFDDLIATLRARYDYVVFDTVPYNIIADAAIINKQADVTIYVIRAEMIDRRFLTDLDRMYREHKINNMCTLLTGVDVEKSYYGYGSPYGYKYGGRYGSYGYRYGYGREGERKSKKKKFNIFGIFP